MLALFGGMLIVCLAIVIDNGTQNRARAESQAVADSASLAGIAEIAVSHDPDLARALAIEYCRKNGFVVGQRGIMAIEAYAYDSTTGAQDTETADRYHVKITRRASQFFVAGMGVTWAETNTMSRAALLSAAPVDVNLELGLDANFGLNKGYPEQASLAIHGPQSGYDRGDPYATPTTQHGFPNGTYQPSGLRFDLVVPSDLEAASGSSLVRVELFDADCYNDPAKYTQGNPTHVVRSPQMPADTDGDPTEPEEGGIDEIFPPAPSMGSTNPAQFPARSTQTEYTLLDRDLNIIAQAAYGPSSNTPFWYHTEDPGTDPLNVAAHADPARAQGAVDLKWVTPEGFEFDTATHPGPYRMMVRSASGSSENGFSLRISARRDSGVAYDPLVHGMTGTSTLSVYAHGKAVVNFMDVSAARFTVASVPSETVYVRIQNFDTEVGAASLWFSMTSFDPSIGSYPILFDAPAGAGGPEVIEDTDGNKYYVRLSGTRAPNAQWRSNRIDVPDPVPVPETDGSGNLVFDAQGRVRIVDNRVFEGGEVAVEYRAGTPGAHDTSGWQFSYFKPQLVTGEQEIVLIR